MRSLLTLAWWLIMVPLDALWAFPWAFITGRIDGLYKSAIWIARVGVRIAGVRAKTSGNQELDLSRNYIFMSNHVSNLDPPVLIPLLPFRVTVMVKKELFKLPILGPAMRIANFVPIDRSNREAAIATVREAEETVRRGLHMVVFPEGTRSRDGRLLPFKKGPFYLAFESGAPCIPVSIYGTEQLMAKGSFAIKRGSAHIVFHPPVYPRDFATREELLQAVRSSIASGLPEWMRG